MWPATAGVSAIGRWPRTPRRAAGGNGPVFDEIKTHQLQSRPVLRSRDPDGVEQEIWGILLLHHALRDLIHVSARDAGIDPDRVSFTRALRAARRQVTDQVGLSPLPATPRPARGNR